MKIQVHRGDKTVTLTAKQAATYVFKPGDRVEVLDHGKVQDVTLTSDANGLHVRFTDGQLLDLNNLLPMLRDHKVSVSLGEQAVLLDGISGQPQTYDMVAIADPSDAQDAPVGPADMRDLPDVVTAENMGLQTPVLEGGMRLPAIHKPQQLNPDPELAVSQDPFKDAPLTGARGHDLQGGAPEGQIKAEAAHLAPQIDNTHPGGQAALAADPTSVAAATDPLSTFLRGLPPLTIDPVTPASSVPVTPSDTNTTPVVPPDQTAPTTGATPPVDTTPVVTPPPATSGGSGGGSGGGGSSPPAPPPPPPPPPLAVTGLTAATDTGASSTDAVTTQPDPVITGTGTPGKVVHVLDGATELGTATVAADGTWSLVLAGSPLAEGTHNVTADLQDGTTPASAALAIVIDLTPPTATADGLTATTDLGVSSTDGLTSNATPTLTGTTEPLGAVQILDGATVLGTATADATGAWTFTPTTALADGDHVITVVPTDLAGNLGATSAPTTIKIDTSAPAAGSIGGLAPASDSGTAGDGITNAAPVLTGTADPGSTIEVFDGTTSLGTTTADGSGTWSFTTTGLTEGAHALTAVASDDAGNAAPASAAFNVTVDTTAPAAPAGLALTTATDSGTLGDDLTNNPTPTLTGTAEPNAAIAIFDGATQIGTATADAAGTWTFTTPTLVDGPHAITAMATDAAANTGAANAPVTFTIDTGAPTAPAALALTTATDSGTLGDNLTNNPTPTFTGTAEPNATVAIFDGATQLGTATADGAGNWSFSAPTLVDGAHAISAQATDAAGNTGTASAPTSFTVDTTPPAVPVVQGLTPATDTGPSNTDGDTNVAQPVFLGTADANTTVSVFDGGTLLGTTTADAGGNWTYATTSDLSNSTHTITASSTDAAGNTSAMSAGKPIKIDATIPNTPVITGLTAATDSGSSSTDAVTNVTTPTLVGTADPGATITVSDGATALGTATADATTGAWTFAVPTPLAEGTHNLTVVATNSSGNDSAPSTPLAVAVDLTAPGAPTLGNLAAASDSGTSSVDAITNVTTPTFTGTTDPNGTVQLFDGATLLGSATADGTGAWSFTPGGALGDGTHAITAKAIDLAGNVGATSNARNVTIDTVAPGAAGVTGLAAGSDTGSSGSDGVTGNVRPTVLGTAPANTAVNVYDGPVLLGTTTADASGNWTFTPPTDLPDGTHNLTARAVDVAGNAGAASSPIAVVVDTTAPVASGAPSLTAATDTGASTTDGVTTNATPTFAGTSDANATVQVFDGPTLLGTTTADGSGAWTFTPSAPLAAGTHDVRTIATDLAGNVGPSSQPGAFVIDTTAPAGPTIQGITPASDTGASSSDGVTANATPEIVGSAEAGAKVEVFDGGVLIGSATADATGAWSLTPATALPDGNHVLTAVATDLAGNAGPASAAKIITINTASPAAPGILGLTAGTDTGASSSDGITANAKPTIAGTASANAIVQVYDGATLLGAATADGSGLWSLTPTAPLAAGSHAITAKEVGAAGATSTASTPFTLVVDTGVPGTTAITGLVAATDTGSSSTDGLTSATTPTLTGTADAGATIQLFDGATALGTTTADGSGAWSFTTPALGQGKHAITAVATDAAGNTGAASAPYAVTVDTTAPGAPTVTGLTAATDTGVSATDGFTSNARPTLTGTAEPNATVQVLDGTTVLGTATTDGAGRWSFTPTTNLADGPHAITAVATDAAGNAGGTSAAYAVTVDATPPGAPSIGGLTPASDSGASTTDGITNVPTPTLAGTADPNSLVQLFEGATLLGTATADGSGNWSFQLPTALPTGSHTITARAIDAAGNVGATTSSFLISEDRDVPNAPVITGLTAATDTGVVGDGVTSNATPTLAGTAEANSTIDVYDGTTLLGTATADGLGAWSLTPATPLAAGAHVITATSTDAAGNASTPAAATTIQIGTVAPAAPVITGLTAATDSGLSAADAVTNQAVPTLAGTAQPGATVQLLDGATVLGTATADATGAWTFTPPSAFTAGDHAITAVATDAAGNTSPASTALTVKIDLAAPGAPTITGLAAGSDLGSSATDNVTNAPRPTLVGNAEAGAQVSVFDGATLLGTTQADGSGHWAFTPGADLAAASHSFTARATDLAGNLGPASAAKTVVVATGAPGAPVVTGLLAATDTGSSSTDGFTRIATPTIQGTATAGATVQVFDGTTLLGSTTADGGGSWSYTPASALADGPHGISAVALDAAGNASAASAVRTIEIDATAPAAPVVVGLTTATDTGVSNVDGVTGDATPTIVGTAEPHATVKVFDGATLLGTATADAAGAWSLTPAVALAEGSHSITASATDAAGNAGGASAAKAIVIDTITGPAPVIDGLTAATDSGVSSTDGITNVATPTLTGTAEANSTVTLLDGATVIGTTTADGSGNWSFTTPALAAGSHSFTATFTDLVGHTSASSAAKAVTVLFAGPATPAITGLSAATDTGASSADGVTKANKPTLTGTAAANTTVQVFDGATQIGNTTADGSGNWSFTPAMALADGTHALAAKAVGPANNGSALSAPLMVVVDTTVPGAPILLGLKPGDDTGASPTDGQTSVTTPTLVGTTEPGLVVAIFDGATQLGTATADGGGNWSFTTAALTAGTHAITARATDLAGNTSPAAAFSIMVDFTAPGAPVVTGLTAATDTGASSTDGMTANATPTIQGTAEAGATVQVFDGAALLGTTTATAGGTWTFTPTTALGNGIHNLTAKATDAAGNASAASVVQAITIDTVAPATPVITGLTAATDTGSSNNDGRTTLATPDIVGTAAANATIQIYDGTTLLGTTTASAGGAWTFTPTTALATGAHELRAVASDAAGNASAPSALKTIVIDPATPGAPVIDGLTAATDTGRSATDGYTSNTNPTLTGSGDAGATLKIFDGATQIGTTTVGADGRWTFGHALAAGTHVITVTATNATGSTSLVSAARSIVVDTGAPAAPTITGLTAATDTGTSSADGTTANATPTLAGTAEANATVLVFDGATQLGTTTADGSGAWSFTPATALTDGPHVLTAKATDQAGNTGGASAARTITVDTVAPATPVITGLTAATDTGASNTDGVTSNATPTLAGTADPNATVTIFDAGVQVATVTATAGGAWSYTPASALALGAHTFTAVASDPAGNASAVTPATVVTIVGAAPAAPVVSGLGAGSDTGPNANDNVTNVATPTIVGTSAPGVTIQVFDGATQLGTTAAGPDGTWSFTPGTALSNTTHGITAKALDAGGGLSPASAAVAVKVDTVAPNAAVITGLTAATDTGSSSTDGVTSVNKPTLTGTAENNAQVQVFDGATLLGTTAASGSGAWTFTPATALSDGQHVLTAKAMDAAGNLGPASAAKTFTVDTGAPPAPTIAGLTAATDTGTSSTDGITSLTTPVLTGSAEANATVQVFDGATLLGTATADGTGAWSYTFPALAAGVHAITAKALDAAGNLGAASAAKAITITPAAPPAPVITGLTSASDTGRSQTDANTSDTTPVIVGTAQANATVQIFDGGTQIGTATANASGAWTFTSPALAANATHAITAKAVDSAGNVSVASAALSVVVDTTAPVAAVVTGLTTATDSGRSTTDAITHDQAPTIQGTAEPNATVQVYDGATLLGTTTASGTGAWSLPLTVQLTATNHNITAKATDAAGNVGPASAIKVVQVDVTPPPQPNITGLTAATDTGTSSTDGITSVTKPTITGTAEINASVQLFDGATSIGTVIADASGNWSLPLTAALTAGAHTITAKATDVAGNTSAASAPYKVTITSTVATPVVTGLDLTQDSGSSATDGVTHYTKPTILGTAASQAQVQIFDGGTLIGTTSATATGAWSFTPTTALAATTHSITAKAIDAAGNTSAASVAKVITIDTGDPAAPVISGLTAATDTGTAGDNITSTARPGITGTSEASALIQVRDNGVLLGTTTATTGGVWTFTPPSNLSVGPHTLTARAVDLAGNDSPISAAKTITIVDLPATPTITGLTAASDTGISQTDLNTKDTTPTLVGTTDPGATVKIFDAGNQIGSVVADNNGAWSFTPTLAVGAHSITAKTQDASGALGASSAGKVVTIDTSTPTVTAVKATANGTFAAGATVSVQVVFSEAVRVDTTGGVPTLMLSTGRAATYASGSGGATLTFTYVVQPGDSSPDLNQQSNTALALNGGVISDLAGNNATISLAAATSLATNNNVVITGAAPATVPIVMGLTSATDSGAFDDNITNVLKPTITGVAPASTLVTIKDGATILGTVTSGANGAWSFTPGSNLAVGNHNITATAGTSTSAGKLIQIDTTAPNAPVVTGLASTSDTGTSTTDRITRITTPTINGTAEANATVQIYDNGVLIDTVVATGGAWTTTPITPLAAGTHNITAKATDAAGNVSATSAAKTITIDTSVPTVPSITGLAAASDTGTSSTDGITTDTTPLINGTGPANAVIQIYDGANLLGTTTSSGTGAWSYTTPGLAVGVHPITARAATTAGGTSAASAAKTIIIESPALTATVNRGVIVSDDTGSSQTDNIINKTLPTIIGTAAPGATITIMEGAAVKGTATADGSGSWSYTFTSALAAGVHPIFAKASMPSGATSTSGTVNVTVDTTAPTVTSVTSSTANGTYNVGDTVTVSVVFSEAVQVDTTPGVPTLLLETGATDRKAIYTSGSGSTTLVFTYVVEAGDTSLDLNYASTAALQLNGGGITDVAGNNATLTLPALAGATSLAGGKAIVIDTTPPTVPTITGLAAGSDTGSSTTDKITNDTTPTLNGTTLPSGKVQIYDDQTLLGTVTANAAGAWTYTPAALAAGVHVFTAKAQDAAGNVSAPSTALVVTLDTTAPTGTIVSGLASASDTGSSQTDNITSDTTPTITGTAEAGASVQILDGAVALGTVTADANGNWSFTPSPALAANTTHSITARATDVAGNLGAASSAKVITIDTSAPLAAVVTGLTAATDTGTSNADLLTNNPKPVITGTAEANSTVQVFDGATLLGTTTASGAGAWSFTPANALGNGTHGITAKATDAAGNTGPASTAKVITIDGAIAAPDITGLAAATDTGSSPSDFITTATAPTIQGTAEANSVVTVKDGATVIGTATASAGGAWSLTPGTALTAGTHTITATATDAAGNTSVASTSMALVVDLTAPAAPAVAGLDAASDLGLSRTDGVTNATKPTIVGTTEANAKVQVFDGATSLGTVTADASGNWSLTPATALSAGTHTITAKATDVAGNVGVASSAYVVVIDTGAPVVPTIAGLTAATDTGVSSTDGKTSVAAPTLTGTTEANALVQVYDGGTLIGSTFADGTGAWSFTTPTLSDATHAITAKATDLAGNTSAASAARSISIDTVAPVTPVITGLTAATDSGTVGDGITSNLNPVITGTAEAGATVKVFDGTTLLGTVAATAGGTWSLPPTALAAGSHALTATATDAAGNVASISAVKTIVVDATAPTAPVIAGLAPATDSGPSAVDGVTNVALPTLVGTAEPNATVQIFDGATQIGTATANGAGAWSFTPGTNLADAIHNLTAKAVDAAGNPSPASASVAVTVDTATPAIPVITGLTAATDTGTAGDGTTSIANPTLQGTAEAGAIVKVFDGATLLGTATAGAGGAWTFTPPNGLTTGAHGITAVATDLAGNASASTAAKTITIDAGAPAAPTLAGPSAATDSGLSSTDGITNVAKPAFSGTAEANATIQIRDGSTVIGTTTADGTGTWTFTPSSNLANGSHPISVVALDAAGNASPASATRTVVVDTTAPAAAVIVGLTAATDTGASSTDGITTNPTPTLVGTAEPGATVQIFDGATSLGTVTAAGDGSWSFATTPLAAGSHGLTATATDAAGNAGPASAAYLVTIDTAALPAAVVSGLAAGMDTGTSGTDGITSMATPTIVGLAKAGATVTVKDGAAVLGTTVADASGNWAYTPAALSAGPHSITATFTDQTGHTSAASAAFSVTVDNSTPATPAFTGLAGGTDTGASTTDGITKVGAPTLAGTAEANATVNVYDGGTQIGSTTADGTGAWSFTPGTALTDGTHVISAVAVDAAGNTSAGSTAKTIVVDTAAPAAPTVVGLSPATDTGVSNLDGITSNNAPVLIGTAEPGAVVKVFDGATLLGTTSADGTGAWSFTPGTLADGSHPITAVATDLAGNTSPASAARTIVIATVVGAAPVITGLTAATDLGASSTDGLTSVSRPTIQGTAAIGATVNVFDGATLLGTTTADASGTWAFTPVGAFAAGSHSITATFTDVVGHTSAASTAYTVEIDLSSPAIPVITGLAAGSDTGASATDGVTSNATPTIQGTAEANSSVQVFDGGSPIGSTTTDASGNWSFTPTAALTDGGHAISVRTVDAAGNASASAAPLAVVIQTASVAAPVVTGLTAGTDSGASQVDGVTNNATPTIAGTGPAGATIQVFDGATQLGTATADAAGFWSLAVPSALAEGAHSLTAKALDGAGNASAASAAKAVTVDLSAPAAAVVTGLAAASDSGSAGDGITNVAKPTIVGTADPGATIQVFDGATLLGGATADGSGAWSFTPATALGAGAHAIAAKATDLAGNVGPLSPATTITVVLAAPGVPTIAGLTAATDTGASSTDGVTSVAAPTVTGTADPNVQVKVYDGMTLVGTATADGTGAWSVTTAPLAAGAHGLTARAVDAAGNASATSSSYGVTIQAGPLAAPVVAGLTIATDTGDSNTDGVTSNATPTLVGTAPANATVEVFDGAASLGTATASAAGTWSFTPATALVDGAHTITATAQDAAGNASAGSTAYALIITAASPSAPTITGLTAATDTGASSTDGLTNDATPTLAGVAAANALVQVFDGATLLGSATADGAGAWSFTPATPLAEGTHAITATTANAAGATSAASAAFNLVVDVTPPAAPTISGLTAATDTGPSSTDGITATVQPTVTGTADPNVQLKIYDGATLLGTTTADGAGAWSFTPGTALAGGSHAIMAMAVDAAGNAGAASPAYALVIGGSAPVAPVVTGLTAATDTGSSNTDGITGVATPTIAGTAEPNASVQVFDGAALLGTTTADGAGAWTLTPGAALASGNHNLTAVAVDGAGVTSAASLAHLIVIDDSIPPTPAISGLAPGSDTGASAVDNLTSHAQPTLQGTGPADALIQVSDGATVLGTAQADHAGAWSFTPGSALAEGQHGLTATAISNAGTAGSASAQFDLTIDTQAPVAPTLAGLTAATDTGVSPTDAITSNATPTLAGTSEGDAVIKIYDGATLLGSTTADNAGAWTFTPGTALADGPHSLTATATDAAGNVSAAAVFRPITVDLSAPAAPVVLGLTPATDTGSNDHDGVTDRAAPTIVGTAEANSTVAVFDGTTLLGTTTTDGAGGWSFDSPTLALGAHQLHAKATDAAGNAGAASADATVTITTAPAPYHLSSVGGTGLWLGDFEHVSLVPAATGAVLSAQDVLALPGGSSPTVPLPGAAGGLVPLDHVPHPQAPGLGAAPDVAPMLLSPDLLRHMG